MHPCHLRTVGWCVGCCVPLGSVRSCIWNCASSTKLNLKMISGCCWAMVATGLVELAYHIKHNNEENIIISPQDLVNNFLSETELEEYKRKGKLNKMGCYVTSLKKALDWIETHGCVIEEICPYIERRQACNVNRNPTHKFEYTLKNVAIEEMHTELINHPLGVQIKATPDQIYKGPANKELLHKKGLNHLNHGVLLVGYCKGTDENKGEYWIIKISWGEKWCDGGYGKVSCQPCIVEKMVDGKRVEEAE